MASKLSVAIVIAMFACCAQANLDKFGDLGTGEEGFYKHCFTKMSLNTLMTAYYRQRVGDMLGEDERLIEVKLDTEFAAYGGSYSCSRWCLEKMVKRVTPQVYEGEKELDSSRCQRLVKYKRLCELVKRQQSGDARVKAIENWLCSTSKSIYEELHYAFFKCQIVPGYPDAFTGAADRELGSVLSYSLEELKQKQKETEEEIAADKKLRTEFDVKIVNEAYSKVNEGIERLPEYVECSKKEVIDNANEKAYRAQKAAEATQRSILWKRQYDQEVAQKQKDEDMALLKWAALGAMGGR